MKLHREGYLIMLGAFVLLFGLGCISYSFLADSFCWLFCIIAFILVSFFCLIVQFFRVPSIDCVFSENDIICPADGKIVVIEETVESEYFKDKRIQISIFMSPLNVHANFNPISGIVRLVKYHKGLFLVAWHPKSSMDNERSTFVIEHSSKKEVLFRQIAGAVARRICYYVSEGETVKTGGEFGFIKFGSRIDLFLPVDSIINVKIGDVVKGRITKIGELVN
jgi:phosphatidylserine decarboxylase